MKNFIKILSMVLLSIIILPSTLNAEKETSIELETLPELPIIERLIEADNKAQPIILVGYEVTEEINNLKIPFSIIEKNDTTLEKGTSKIEQEGIDGVKTVTDRLILEDQKEIYRKNISSKTIKDPVNKILIIGTKEKDKIKKEKIYFITKNLDLLENPSSESKILITIPKGTHLDYISTEEDWFKISYQNKTGYISANHVQIGNGYKVENTLIVNKGYPLSSNFNPGVNPEALKAVNNMKIDAQQSGVILNIFSDFRPYQYQVDLYNKSVEEDGKKEADTYYARPGYSEHQTGLAFDIGGKNPKYYISPELGQMNEGLWMAKNSSKYGLILRYPKGKENITGYNYEPWHFRYVGVELAQKIKDRGLTLDEYLEVVQVHYVD